MVYGVSFEKQKKIRFSGAGYSPQNGAAERAIKTVVTMASTMFMHTALRSPEETFTTYFWLMEIYYSLWIYN